MVNIEKKNIIKVYSEQIENINAKKRMINKYKNKLENIKDIDQKLTGQNKKINELTVQVDYLNNLIKENKEKLGM